MDNLTALRREQDQDRKQKTNERPGAGPFQEHLVVPSATCGPAENEAREDRSTQRDAEKDSDAFGSRGVFESDGIATDDFDEEDAHGGEKDDLEEGIDGDENGAVFAVAACKASPD